MFAKEMVKQAVLGACVIVAVPPEPVGALGDIDFFPRPGDAGPIVPADALLARQELAGRVQGVPASVIFGMADPDREVVADPTAREQPMQRIGRRMRAHELAGLDRSDPVIARRALI